ncbi:hypothetical protein EIN_194620 [Entamoeba invadens IP1]|uniref:Uncharacterized protein n=1 Tax=Entamoeba invadens IP1 TaxID=370355 RepID=A0A0A1U9I2_ENTIV|nr:hypothetical protein EIN_194620 [Entamoeba invadens IP1]ELP88703.1 hypothetical protein EIN_194620 [Entamoeba invadens IP1]|eukprot:XP_004255474.1 hypothetical protein EIN_194620 [Entamoeba invadens IP1]
MYTNTVEEMEVLKILFVESYSLHCKETNCIVRLTSQVSQFSTLSVQKFIMLLKEFEGVQDTFVQHKAESKNFGRISETHILHTKYLSELLNEKIVRKQEEVGCREVDQKVVEFGVETQKTFITNVLKTLEIISKQLLLMSSKHSKSYQSNSSPFTQKSILNMTHSRRGTL